MRGFDQKESEGAPIPTPNYCQVASDGRAHQEPWYTNRDTKPVPVGCPVDRTRQIATSTNREGGKSRDPSRFFSHLAVIPTPAQAPDKREVGSGSFAPPPFDESRDLGLVQRPPTWLADRLPDIPPATASGANNTTACPDCVNHPPMTGPDGGEGSLRSKHFSRIEVQYPEGHSNRCPEPCEQHDGGRDAEHPRV